MGQSQCCCQSEGGAPTDLVEQKKPDAASPYADAVCEGKADLGDIVMKEDGSHLDPCIQVERKEAATTNSGNGFSSNPDEFCVTLIKSTSQPYLGLAADTANSDYLVVECIEGGLLGNWNIANPDKAVSAGDCIVKVNGWKGDANEMADLIRNTGKLELTIVKTWR